MVDFSLLQTPDYFGGAVNALQAGQQQRQQRDRRNALVTYGTDKQAGINALLGSGDVQTASQLQGMDRATAQEGREVAQDTRQAAEFKLKQTAAMNGLLLNGVKSISAVPEEQRNQYFATNIAPQLKEAGVADAMIQRLAAAPKDDKTLGAYGIALGKEQKDIEYQFVNLGDGGVGRGRKDTGAFETIREPERQPFAMDPQKTYVDLGNGSGGGAGAAPRNQRNNNPGNIEDGDFAKSLPGYKGSDGRYAIFETPEQGAQGQVALLQSYGKRGFNTPAEIINRWAPPSDGNPTSAYAAFVAKELGVPVDEELNLANPSVARKVADAITKFEGSGAAPTGPRVIQQATPKVKEAPSGYRYKGDVLEFIPGGPADPATKTSAGLKPIPPKIQQGYVENNATLTQIDQAIALIRENPNALGLKNLAGDAVTQRLDPNGISVRAAVANIGSKLIHDRSGAAVTASETPRLKPFVPSSTDGADAAIKKLLGLRQQVENETNGIEIAYGEDSGYRPMVKAGSEAGTLPPEAAARLKAGHNTTFANGQVWTVRDGKPVKVK